MNPSALGIALDVLFAGLAGGVCCFFVMRSGGGSAVGSIIVGGFSANYLAHLAQPLLANVISTITVLQSAFVIGLCGMPICKVIIDKVQQWKPGGPTP